MAPVMLRGISSGAYPTATFPNSHLLAPKVPAAPSWSAPQQGSPLAELRAAVSAEDWERAFEEGLTKINMRPEWSASEDRCAMLQTLATTSGARRILEIGSFCGVGTLALAEALPEDGEVRAVELDAFSVDFGRRFQVKSPAGRKIRTTVEDAQDFLHTLARDIRSGHTAPFDMIVIDADKEGMQEYFETVWNTPGFLSANGVVCVDTTPFKGQAPIRYVKYGFPHRWETISGKEHIDSLRTAVSKMQKCSSNQFGELLLVHRE